MEVPEEVRVKGLEKAFREVIVKNFLPLVKKNTHTSMETNALQQNKFRYLHRNTYSSNC